MSERVMKVKPNNNGLKNETVDCELTSTLREIDNSRTIMNSSPRVSYEKPGRPKS